ncbi:hypothetical protein B0T10DRAFT_577083 [Thelonectria olida]|uniref:Uncharacterized protein n=1 Tax=Thelonectria olida TaxID=1576542 RepID=A0A9P8VYU9_9HYPO|nr:hypothetical protein B0T10DRAFT_577083 [Thelonectria olida]
MYFKPCYVQGSACHDGDLKANNPVQDAVNACRKIWGGDRHIPFDLILSDTFCRDSADRGIFDRASRLNVRLERNTEPALDDVGAIPEMETAAPEYHFPYKPSDSPFSPINGNMQGDMLQSLADRLRASLYFFQVGNISCGFHKQVVIDGWICCRLLPTEKGIQKLLSHTTGFQLQGECYRKPIIPWNKPMKWEVQISEDDTKAPIRIDVNFVASHFVSISGFPMTLEVSIPHIAYWNVMSKVANVWCFLDIAVFV